MYYGSSGDGGGDKGDSGIVCGSLMVMGVVTVMWLLLGCAVSMASRVISVGSEAAFGTVVVMVVFVETIDSCCISGSLGILI